KEGVVAAESAAGLPTAAEWTTIPDAIFTDPEIATAGLTEVRAVAAGYTVKKNRFPFAALGRALSTGEPEGFVKIVSDASKELVAARVNDSSPDTLILVEHEHVVTLGRRTSVENFRPQGVPVFNVERGGDATYHGPGQLVGYPILKLEDHDVHRYLRMLEEV